MLRRGYGVEEKNVEGQGIVHMISQEKREKERKRRYRWEWLAFGFGSWGL